MCVTVKKKKKKSFLLCLLRSDFARFYGTAAAEGENGIVCSVFAVTHVYAVERSVSLFPESVQISGAGRYVVVCLWSFLQSRLA